jgi:hypothetical protein
MGSRAVDEAFVHFCAIFSILAMRECPRQPLPKKLLKNQIRAADAHRLTPITSLFSLSVFIDVHRRLYFCTRSNGRGSVSDRKHTASVTEPQP